MNTDRALRIALILAIGLALELLLIALGLVESVAVLGYGALTVGVILIGEAYLLIWKLQEARGDIERAQRTGEQILDAAARLLALAPGKSAPRTEAPADVKPRVWLTRLRALPAQRVIGPDDVQLDRWADDGGTVLPAVPSPTGPVTRPDLRRAATTPPPAPGTPPLDRAALDDADRALARFRERTPTTTGPHRHRYEEED